MERVSYWAEGPALRIRVGVDAPGRTEATTLGGPGQADPAAAWLVARGCPPAKAAGIVWMALHNDGRRYGEAVPSPNPR